METDETGYADIGVVTYRPVLPGRVGSTNAVTLDEVEQLFDPVSAIDWARARRDMQAASARMVEACLRDVSLVVAPLDPACTRVRFIGGQDRYGRLALDDVLLDGASLGVVPPSLEVAWRCLASVLAAAGIEDLSFEADLALRRVMTSCGTEEDAGPMGVLVEFDELASAA